MDNFEKSFKILSPKIQSSFNYTLDLIKRIPIEKISIGFNGGKDSTATFFLFLAAILRLRINPRYIHCVYIMEKDPFPEVIDYVDIVNKEFGFQLIKYQKNGRVDKEFMKKCLVYFITN